MSQRSLLGPLDGPGPELGYGPHEADLFDWRRGARLVVFALRSVRRRILLFLLVLFGMVGLTVAALLVLPKTYQVESRILAQPNPVLATRGTAGPADQPSRAAAELIVRTENVRSLVRQSKLLEEWPNRRAPIGKFKDWLRRQIGRAPSQQELEEGLTDYLQKELVVWATPEGTIGIRLNWPDALMAVRLVDLAEQNFFEARHVLEVSTIAEQISILEGHATQLKKEVERQVAELQQQLDRSPRRGAPPVPRPAVPRATEAEGPNLRVMLDAKRLAIADLEEMRRKHLAELQTRLAEQRAVLAETHPSVVSLQQSIESLQSESPQLTLLRQEEAALRQRLSKQSRDDVNTGMPTIPPELFTDLLNEDPSVEYARSQLRFALQQYATMRAQIGAARIDLDTAQAAFKYRYSVVVPPEMPRGPIKPKATMILIAAIIGGLLLALFSTTAADLHSGALLEDWQLEGLLSPSTPVIKLSHPWPAPGQLPPANQQ